MTQPGSLELLDRQDRRAIAREDRLADELTRPLQDLNAQLQRELTRIYTRIVGGPDETPTEDQSWLLRAALIALMTRWAARAVELMAAAINALTDAAVRAVDFGIGLARQWLGEHIECIPYVDPAIQQAIADLRQRIDTDIGYVRTLPQVLHIRRQGDMLVLAGKANIGNPVERTARWIFNRGANHGVGLVAQQVGAEKLWVAERDACLTCLAYSGQTVGALEMFPAGLTYGDKSSVRWPIPGPPAHPNCRCRLQVWLGSEEGVGPVEMPEALRREAQRTVARGWTEHASEPAKVRAASRLLTAGATLLPRSVLDHARSAVVAGRFQPDKLADKRPTRGRVPRVQRVPPWGRPHIQRAR